MMPLQRTCGAESQVRNKLSNGPLRVQSNEIFGVYCNVWTGVTGQGYVSILKSAWEIHELRWHHGLEADSSLTDSEKVC